MSENKPNIRLRLVVVKDNKLLVQYSKNAGIYFYIGGHQDFGESMLEGCVREIKEECGDNYEFIFKKILYVRDYIDPTHNESNLEIFILGALNNYDQLEGKLDPQHPDGSVFATWLDINNLPDNLYPQQLSEKLLKDFNSGFAFSGEYVGKLK